MDYIIRFIWDLIKLILAVFVLIFLVKIGLTLLDKNFEWQSVFSTFNQNK
jgi:hypothetical protein